MPFNGLSGWFQNISPIPGKMQNELNFILGKAS